MELNFWMWIFIVVFMIHNFEEIFTVEYWFKKIYPHTRDRLPAPILQQLENTKSMTAGQFAMAVFVLFLPVSALLIISVTTELYFLFFGANLFFALNILTHPLQAIYLKRYVPGLWTSLFVVLPYNFVLFILLTQAGGLDTRTIILSLIVTALLFPVLPFAHKAAEYWKRNFT
jgi:hypothetical protein